MRQSTNRSGYILVLTLIVLSIVVLIATQLFFNSSSFSLFAHTAVARERAKLLALSGVQIARNQLFLPAEAKKNEARSVVVPQAGKAPAAPAKPEGAPTAVRLLRKVLPLINRWQKTTITNESGIDGTITWYIACEDGKLLLNAMLATLGAKRVPKQEKQCMFDVLAPLGQLVGFKENPAAVLYNVFKKRQGVWFNDVTEVLTIPAFAVFADRLYVTPRSQASSEVSGKKIQSVYLTDIFTSRAGSGMLNPWVLSASMRTMLGLAPIKQEKAASQEFEEILKNYKPNFNWRQDWDKVLKPWYGKDLQSLPKGFDMMLAKNCEPTFFSVLVQGTVDGVTQQMYVLLARAAQPDSSVTFEPFKVYWI